MSDQSSDLASGDSAVTDEPPLDEAGWLGLDC
jgi:hypothetical protein